MTEITDNIGGSEMKLDRGVLFYDAACAVCRGGAARFHAMLERHGFRVMPLQSDEAVRLTGATPEALLAEVHLVTATRKVLRGVDALLYVADAIPWAMPLRWLSRVPGVKRGMDALYRWFAAHRHGISATCGLDASKPRGWETALRWLPPVLLVAISFAGGRLCPAWVWMWGIAMSMFFACKWAAWWPVRHGGTIKRDLAYFLAWTGMDADAFLAGAAPTPPVLADWMPALGKTLGGATLVWVIARLLWPHAPTAAAWAGMVGVCMMLHFGLMHLIALAWRSVGVAAEPLMRKPASSTSLGEFWGRRWNTGFRFLAYDLLFRKLVRPIGIAGATAVVFLVSGLIHDAVISIPARGGYGLPTLYFLVQLLGVLAERAKPLKRVLRRPLLGWMYVAVFTIAPIGLLFPTAFIERVIVPFLHAIGGL